MESDLVVGLLGAVVGGAASLVGSVIVNRMQLVRAARIRMFKELLPPLVRKRLQAHANEMQEGLGSSIDDYIQAFHALSLESVIAGRKDEALVVDLSEIDNRRYEILATGEWLEIEGQRSWAGDMQALLNLNLEYGNRVAVLHYYLADRIHGRWRRLRRSKTPPRVEKVPAESDPGEGQHGRVGL